MLPPECSSPSFGAVGRPRHIGRQDAVSRKHADCADLRSREIKDRTQNAELPQLRHVRRGEKLSAHFPPRIADSLDHRDRPSGLREQERCRRTGRPCTDNDGII